MPDLRDHAEMLAPAGDVENAIPLMRELIAVAPTTNSAAFSAGAGKHTSARTASRGRIQRCVGSGRFECNPDREFS